MAASGECPIRDLRAKTAYDPLRTFRRPWYIDFVTRSADTYAEFVDLLASGHSAGPVPAQEVEAAEQELGVCFPKQYRDFLMRYGAILAPGLEIYGLVEPVLNDPPLWTDIRRETRRLRTVGQVGTEYASFLPIADDGFGNYYFLNTAAAQEGEIWMIGPYGREIVSTNLYDFALRRSAGSLG